MEKNKFKEGDVVVVETKSGSSICIVGVIDPMEKILYTKVVLPFSKETNKTFAPLIVIDNSTRKMKFSSMRFADGYERLCLKGALMNYTVTDAQEMLDKWITPKERLKFTFTFEAEVEADKNLDYERVRESIDASFSSDNNGVRVISVKED